MGDWPLPEPSLYDHVGLAGGCHHICSAGGLKVGVLERSRNAGGVQRNSTQTWNTGEKHGCIIIMPRLFL